MKGGLTAFMVLVIVQVTAQSVSDTINIPLVTVEAKSEEGAGVQQMDSLQIDNPVHANLGELLEQNSSAFVKSYGIGSMSTVSMRGAGSSHSQLLWNGISLNSSTNGVVDFSLFPLELFSQVSVYEGISSLEKNGGALGGIVDLKSKQPINDEVRLSYSVGSFGWQRASLNWVQSIKKWTSQTRLFYTEVKNNFDYQDVGSPGFPEKELQNARLEQTGFKQDISLKLNEKNRIGTELWYFNSERQLPTIFTVNNAQEFQQDKSFRIQLKGDHYLQKAKLKWTSAYLNDEIIYENYVSSILSISLSQSWRSYVNYEQELSKKASLDARLNLNVDQADNPAFEKTLHQNRVALFGALNYQLKKRWRLKTGSRIEQIINHDLLFMPFAETQWILPKQKVSLSLGQNIKYPNLNDLYWIPGGNPDLEAEKSSSIDLNHEWQLVSNEKWRIKSHVSLFYNHMDQFIFWKPTAFGYWQAENIKAVYARGGRTQISVKRKGKVEVEWSGHYSLTQSRSLHQSHPYDLSKNKQLIYLPEHQFKGHLYLKYRSLSSTLNYQFIGARYTTTDNLDFLPYYQLLDWTLTESMKWKKTEIEMSFSIQNLLDEDYQAIAWRPMPGRNYLFKLSYAFK